MSSGSSKRAGRRLPPTSRVPTDAASVSFPGPPHCRRFRRRLYVFCGSVPRLCILQPDSLAPDAVDVLRWSSPKDQQLGSKPAEARYAHGRWLAEAKNVFRSRCLHQLPTNSGSPRASEHQCRRRSATACSLVLEPHPNQPATALADADAANHGRRAPPDSAAALDIPAKR